MNCGQRARSNGFTDCFVSSLLLFLLFFSLLRGAEFQLDRIHDSSESKIYTRNETTESGLSVAVEWEGDNAMKMEIWPEVKARLAVQSAMCWMLAIQTDRGHRIELEWYGIVERRERYFRPVHAIVHKWPFFFLVARTNPFVPTQFDRYSSDSSMLRVRVCRITSFIGLGESFWFLISLLLKCLTEEMMKLISWGKV